MRHLTCLFSLALCAGSALAAPRPVGVQEAQSFGERVTRQLLQHDRRAVQAYRADSEFLLLLTQTEPVLGVHLKGAELHQFLRQNMERKVPVKTGTSCRYDARLDGLVLESCISVNVMQPAQPNYSVSVIARKGKALYYQVTLVTDSAEVAAKVGVYGDPDEEDVDDEKEELVDPASLA